MIAYKFLKAGALGRFSGLPWPVPSDRAAAQWVEVAGPVTPCVSGIHACRALDLVYWMDDELWEIELTGELVQTPTMVVARRGRLTGLLSSWRGAQRDFAAFCRERTGDAAAAAATAEQERHARKWLSDVLKFTDTEQFATVAYVAAIAAQLRAPSEPDAAYREERAVQARWLAARLGLAA